MVAAGPLQGLTKAPFWATRKHHFVNEIYYRPGREAGRGNDDLIPAECGPGNCGSASGCGPRPSAILAITRALTACPWCARM